MVYSKLFETPVSCLKFPDRTFTKWRVLRWSLLCTCCLSYPCSSSQQATEQTGAASCSDPNRSFRSLKSPILYVGNLPFTYAQLLLFLVACTYVRPCLSCRSTAHPISATTRFYRKGFLMNDLGRVHYEEGSAPVTSEDTGGAGGRWEAHRKINKKREGEKVFYTIL